MYNSDIADTCSIVSMENRICYIKVLKFTFYDNFYRHRGKPCNKNEKDIPYKDIRIQQGTYCLLVVDRFTNKNHLGMLAFPLKLMGVYKRCL